VHEKGLVQADERMGCTDNPAMSASVRAALASPVALICVRRTGSNALARQVRARKQHRRRTPTPVSLMQINESFYANLLCLVSMEMRRLCLALGGRFRIIVLQAVSVCIRRN